MDGCNIESGFKAQREQFSIVSQYETVSISQFESQVKCGIVTTLIPNYLRHFLKYFTFTFIHRKHFIFSRKGIPSAANRP